MNPVGAGVAAAPLKAGWECVLVPATCAVGKVVEASAPVIDFMKDPLGYIASSLQKSCESMARTLLPKLAELLQPRLDQAWFLEVYKVSFAVAVILWGFLILHQLMLVSRGRAGGDDLASTFTVYTPMFFAGALFGPAIGAFMCSFVGALCKAFTSWGGDGGNLSSASSKLVQLITSTDIDRMVGGPVLAIVLFGFMLIGLVGILVSLLFMMVTLYLAGSVFPVGWAWITRSQSPEKGWKIVYIWAGILFAQPLVFFLLQVVTGMLNAGLFGMSKDPVAGTIALAGATLALLMVAAGPFAANQFAPVGPTEANPSGTKLSGWGGKGSFSGGRGSAGVGSSSGSDGQLGKLSRSGGGTASASGGGGGTAAKTAGGAAGGSAAAAAGPLGLAAAASSGQKPGGDTLLDKVNKSGEKAGSQTEAAASHGSSGGSSSPASQASGTSSSGSSAQGGDSSAGSGDSRGGSLNDRATTRSGAGSSPAGQGGSGSTGSGGSGGQRSSGAGSKGGGAPQKHGGSGRSLAGLFSGAGAAAMSAGKGTGSVLDAISRAGATVERQTAQHLDHQHDAPRARR